MISPTQKQLIEQKAEEMYPVRIIGYMSQGIGPCPPIDAEARDRETWIKGATYFAENLAMRWVKAVDADTLPPKEWDGCLKVIRIGNLFTYENGDRNRVERLVQSQYPVWWLYEPSLTDKTIQP